MRRVIKFGGTSLATPKHFAEAATTIASLAEMGEQIAVVVSAMGNETSELLSLVDEATNGSAGYKTQLTIASMAEEKSVLLMVAALSAKKVNAVPFFPRKSETWPIIVDTDDISTMPVEKVNEERDFTLRTQRTSHRFAKYVLPLLRVGQVPVISGFVALDSKDELVSFGRGGSDITAFIVGRYVDCEEIVIVTDAKGIMSSDPRLIDNPLLLSQLSVEEVEAIAGTGGRVIHPRALRFKTANMNVRVIDYKQQKELTKVGTRIYGTSQTRIYRNDKKLAMVVVMGSNWFNRPGILGRLAQLLAEQNIPISSASVNSRFISFYLEEKDAEKARKVLHEEVATDKENFLNLNVLGGVGEICLSSSGFIETAGVIAEFTRALAHKNINILEVITSVTDINIYVKWDKLDEAYKLLLKLVKTRWSG